ncbi:NUDIX domain-containing protein [Elizabethkingia argentiflava]|uniref:NUDIX domain-containing protein n=1 Tax=Elizabethkingia argenteiflava TaxID=2681556 RepID=A0A845Q0N2_9FLAO|nr:NUDIX hydrolase [Elizabethkingia argenteiflava]NAW51870.1 NUDIX domain-containing protein [Elizabethkingia argenteiflava]
METIDRYNIRVYALCIEDQNILTLFESYCGKDLLKLPGGGLEFGESILDCLHREFMEELNVKIEIIEHFYTQETFLRSLYQENEQLLTIYYRVKIKDFDNLKIQVPEIKRAEWFPLSAPNPFCLTVDQLVFEKAQHFFLK